MLKSFNSLYSFIVLSVMLSLSALCTAAPTVGGDVWVGNETRIDGLQWADQSAVGANVSASVNHLFAKASASRVDLDNTTVSNPTALYSVGGGVASKVLGVDVSVSANGHQFRDDKDIIVSYRDVKVGVAKTVGPVALAAEGAYTPKLLGNYDSAYSGKVSASTKVLGLDVGVTYGKVGQVYSYADVTASHKLTDNLSVEVGYHDVKDLDGSLVNVLVDNASAKLKYKF